MDNLQKFINYISNEKRFSTHTIRAYHDDIASFFLYCNYQTDKQLLETSGNDVRSWLISLAEQKLSPRTYRRKLSSLKTFFKFLLTEGVLTHNPVEGVVSPKYSKPIPEFFTEKEVVNLFDYVVFQDSFMGVRDELILKLFYNTGMRLSELVSLKIHDIDFSLQQIRVFGKRKKQRNIPVTENTLQLIKKYLTKREQVKTNESGTLLFIIENGRPAYARMIQRIVKKYLQQITTSNKVHPHKIRHTFATHMLNNGADLNAVKELLGHANLSATEVYTHNTYEKLRSIYNQAHPRA